MSTLLDLSITAPFGVGDLPAVVDLDNGETQTLILRSGRFHGELPARATRVRLSTDVALDESDLHFDEGDQAGESKGEPATLHELFEHGREIPASGVLALSLSWGAPCHVEELPDGPATKRFGSWEHVISARLVGLDAKGSKLEFRGAKAPFTEKTRLPVGDKELTFGQIVSLAGDFYAHLDDAAKSGFADAWPAMSGVEGWVAGDYRATTLRSDAKRDVEALFAIIERDKDDDTGAAGEFIAAAMDTAKSDYPARRYLALASQNFCHFSCPRPGGGDATNEALQLYRRYHERALAEATSAADAVHEERALLQALATDAFGCHFLTDLFASGHMRVPRRTLGERYGITVGALHMSHSMHAEDNALGLWCTTRLTPAGSPRRVWRAYGDGMLRKEVSLVHLEQLEEAVRRSAAEVFAAFCGERIPPAERAEARIPVPLPPGEGPGGDDEVLHRGGVPSTPNHYPLYWYRTPVDPSIMTRKGDPHENRYRTVFSPLSPKVTLAKDVFL